MEVRTVVEVQVAVAFSSRADAVAAEVVEEARRRMRRRTARKAVRMATPTAARMEATRVAATGNQDSE